MEAAVQAVGSALFGDVKEGFPGRGGALSFALSLRDEPRAIAVRDTLIAYERAASQDALAGTWGAAFDALVENHPQNLPMPPPLVAELVADLEARLLRFPHLGDPNRTPDGFAVEGAALRLARYYRRIGDPASIRRVRLVDE